jgi:hypothetical protein
MLPAAGLPAGEPRFEATPFATCLIRSSGSSFREREVSAGLLSVSSGWALHLAELSTGA